MPNNTSPFYPKEFFLTKPKGNNQINYFERLKFHQPKLRIAPLKYEYLNKIQLNTSTFPAFEAIDENNNLQSVLGLEFFFKTHFKNIPIYIFDNHNHAYFFWHFEIQKSNLQTPLKLIHIDQHKDTRIPPNYLSKPHPIPLQEIFHYTNNILNVGNFIPPAINDKIITSNIIFINSENSLNKIQNSIYTTPNYNNSPNNQPFILDIDLDFFSSDLNYIPKQKKLKIIHSLIPNAKLITIATSPFFIPQSEAFQIFYEIFNQLTLNFELSN